jgi:hypothetical protein
MDLEHPPEFVPASPDYVLAVLREELHLARRFGGDADAGSALSFDTTVLAWLSAWDPFDCDLVDEQALGRHLNTEWAIACPAEDWLAVLKPTHTQTLGGVCALIARHAVRPLVRPVSLFGCTCAPAGAFLSLRSQLRQAGIDVERIAPSTLLGPYLVWHREAIFRLLARLAPGWLPSVSVETPLADKAGFGVVVALVNMLVGWLAGWQVVLLAGILELGVYVAVIPAALQWHWLERVTFGDLCTFRDLAVLVAEGSAAV